MDTATFRFASTVALRVRGDRASVEHFRREYGPCLVDLGGAPDVALTVVGRPIPAFRAERRRTGARSGRHKTVGWELTLGPADGQPLAATISVVGWPASIGRSLAQGYLAEPIVSMAAAHRGLVLLPAAAIGRTGGVVVILGRSRAGKSTLSARAMAAGATVLGDDQVFVDGDGSCWAFPRRLRFYPDIEQTAPAAHASLRPRTRMALRLRRAVAALSFGYVRPSLAVAPAELGAAWSPGGLPFGSVVLVERSAAVTELDRTVADGAAAIEWATELLRDQRSRLRAVADEAWRESLDRVIELERATLARAFARASVELVRIPAAWDAPRAIEALDRLLLRGS